MNEQAISIDLDQSIGFWTSKTYRKLSFLLQQRLKAYDITSEQWSMLYHVGQEDGLIQKEIAQRVAKDKPTTTRMLDLLSDKGLIKREPGKKDRRSFLIYATDKGRQLLAETLPIENLLIQEVKSCMSSEEYELLLNLLRRVSAHADTLLNQPME